MERSELSEWIDWQIGAYHQAAHAIMAIELGRPVWAITLDDGSGYGATATVMDTHDPRMPPFVAREAALRDALFLLAGWAIDAHLARNPTPRHHAAGTDVQMALRRIEAVVGAPDAQQSSLSFLQERAREIVTRPDVLLRIRHVTDGLLKRGSLSERDVLRAIDAADGQYGARPRMPLLARQRTALHPNSPVLKPVAWRSGPPVVPKRAMSLSVALASTRSPKASRPTRRELRARAVPNFGSVAFAGVCLGALRRGGITSLAELLRWSEAELTGIRAVGAVIARQIATAVREAGFRLRDDPEKRDTAPHDDQTDTIR